jgi:two-component system OmpR family response regulator
VLAVTSRTDVESRVTALDAGADDCIVKPFAVTELVARLRALLRRSSRCSKCTHFGELSLESNRRVVWVHGKPVALSPRENVILHHLVRRGCHFSSRQEILREVLGYNFDPGTNIVEVHIAHLRRKLAGCNTRIESLRGAGYRLRTGSDDDRNAEP